MSDTSDTPHSQQHPPGGRDPRLEIPEVLRTPVKAPESYRRGEPAGGPLPSGGGADQAKGWAIAMNFVYGVIAGGLIGWAVQTWLLKTAAPWPLLIGLGLGLVGGLIRFVREGLRANAQDLPRSRP